jgi:heat shock protein HtpX
MAQINPKIHKRHGFNNMLHTVLLVIGTGLLMGVLAYMIFGWLGLVIAVVFGMIGIMSLGRTSPKMVLGLYKARPLEQHEAPELHRIMQQLAERAELPAVPKLYYVPTKMLNAFAVGKPEDSAVAVTDGLLRIMNIRQLSGILGHEVAHIMNGDLRVMGLADVLNRITSFISNAGLIGVPLVFGTGLDIPLLAPILMIGAPFIGGLLQMGLSRAREYDADLDGAILTGDPEGLASALQVLEQQQQRNWEGMVLPGSRMPQPSLMRTHPKTEERIKRLMALRSSSAATQDNSEQIVVRHDESRPQTSFVPPVSNPHIRWHKLGVYY